MLNVMLIQSEAVIFSYFVADLNCLQSISIPS